MTASTVSHRYALRAPCVRCPFRTDVEPYLRSERAEEIAASIRGGAEFPCHKTTVPDVDEDGWEELVEGKDTQVCAGAVATLLANGETNQMLRISERLGLADYDRLVTTAPLYDSLTHWVEAHRPPTELEHCGVAGPDCQDPCGFDSGHGVFGNAEAPTCDPDFSCQYCGAVMCEGCSAEEEENCCVFCVAEGENEDDE